MRKNTLVIPIDLDDATVDLEKQQERLRGVSKSSRSCGERRSAIRETLSQITQSSVLVLQEVWGDRPLLNLTTLSLMLGYPAILAPNRSPGTRRNI